jgi:glycosyltransferase involved in cell wall biosynthesis
MSREWSSKPAFTVFVPTYNRVHLLPRLLECMEAQTFQDFELLIVDDGSTDGTYDYLSAYQPKEAYQLRVFRQSENLGMPMGFNVALEHARGLLFVAINSDDTLPENALDRFWYWWQYAQEHYPETNIVGVEGLCGDMETGEVLGQPFPQSPMVSDRIEVHFVHRCRGDKVRAVRTDIIGQYRFPQVSGEKFIEPAYIWNQLGYDQYKLLYVNEILCYKEYLKDGLTKNLFRVYSQNPRSLSMYNALLVDRSLRDGRVPEYEIRNFFANWVRFSLYTESLLSVIRHSKRFGLPRGLWLKGILIGIRRRVKDVVKLLLEDG